VSTAAAPPYAGRMATAGGRPPVAVALRAWRERRRLSQLALAERAEVSQKHLAYIEAGRARPSAEMVLHLARHLDVPLRQTNDLLLAAGYAPRYSAVDWDDPGFAPVREAVAAVLRAHEPAPAVVVDHRWDLLAGNRAARLFTAGVAPELLVPPVNVLRVCLHPDGLARRIRNLGEWGDHVLTNLGKQLALAPSADLGSLRDEMAGHLAAQGVTPATDPGPPRLAVPLHLATEAGDLRLLATVATFGTALDATLAELTIEAFLPADDETRRALARLAPPD
jgi:transcriptional regulator with XRE-family HTH domain